MLTEKNRSGSVAELFQKKSVVAASALLCCALWGSAYPAIKLGYSMLDISGAGSEILFGGYRFLLAGIITLLVSAASGHRLSEIKKSSWPYVFGQGMLQTTAQYILFYIGLANASGARSSIINGANSFFSIVIAHFLISSDRITKRKTIGCAVGFAGIIAMNLAGGADSVPMKLTGEGFVLLSSLAYGASTVTMKLISRRENTTLVTGAQFVIGSIVMIAVGLLLGGKVEGFSAASVLLLVYLAALSAVAFSLWAFILRYNPVSKVAIFGFTIPVFGVFFSAVFLRENVFTFNNLIALLFVSAGILLVNSAPADKGTAGSR